MSNQFKVNGLSLDNDVAISYGTNPPGNTTETDTAAVGSVYYDSNGIKYKKTSYGAGTVVWELGVSQEAISVNGITANTVTVLDSVSVIDVDMAVWAVQLSETNNPANSINIIITGTHDGIIANYTVFSRLIKGAPIAGLSYDVLLSNGNLQLNITAGVAYNATCSRLSAMSQNSLKVIATGGGSNSGGLSEIPVATDIVLGGIKAGTGVNIAADGTLTVESATLIDTYLSVDSTLFNFEGTSIPTVGVSRWYPHRDVTLANAYFSVESVGDDDTILQTKVNGIATGDLITCVAGDYKSNVVLLSTEITTNDYVTFDIVGGGTAKNITAVCVFKIISNVPLNYGPQGFQGVAGINGIDGAKGDTGTNAVSLVFKGTVVDQASLPVTGNVQNDAYIIAGSVWVWNGSSWFDGGVIGSGGSGGSGLQVLTDGDYFSPDGNAANADYKYVSIGNGSGTDGADYVDIYAFVDFINGVSIRSRNCVFGYFKNPGVVELDRDLYITNGEGNYFIQGAGVDDTVENAPWSDPVITNIISIITTNNSSILTVEVDNASGLYIGGLLNIYPDTLGVLTYSKLLVGSHLITAINGTNITLSGKYDVFPAGITISAIGGLSIPAKCNRTTLTSNNNSKLVIYGHIGNPAYEGGLYNLSFYKCRLYLHPSSSIILYDNFSLFNTDIYQDANSYILTWGDSFFGHLYGVTPISSEGRLVAYNDCYFGGVILPLSGTGSFQLFLGKLITASNADLTNVRQGSHLIMVNPDIGNLGLTLAPLAKVGSIINIISNYDDM